MTQNNDGTVTLKIPYTRKGAGEVKIEASEIEGKSDKEIEQLAKEKIKEANNPKPAPTNPIFGNWQNYNPS